MPYAFTEQGIYMLMTVLKGELAIKQSKALIRIFKMMKDYITGSQVLLNQSDYLQLALKITENTKDIEEIKAFLNTMNSTVEDVTEQLKDVVTKAELSEMIDNFKLPEYSKEYVLWDGRPFESDLAYTSIYQQAEKTLYVIDNYIGIKTLALLKNSNSDVEIILFSDNVGKGLHESEFKDFSLWSVI